jgi:hypothetical protein
MLSWHVDEHHLLTGFPYHDGELTSVCVNRDGRLSSAVISMTTASESPVVLRLEKVEELSVTCFLPVNTLGDIFLWKYSELTAQQIKKMEMDRFDHASDSLVISIESVYGAEVKAIFGNLQVLISMPKEEEL